VTRDLDFLINVVVIKHSACIKRSHHFMFYAKYIGLRVNDVLPVVLWTGWIWVAALPLRFRLVVTRCLAKEGNSKLLLLYFFIMLADCRCRLIDCHIVSCLYPDICHHCLSLIHQSRHCCNIICILRWIWKKIKISVPLGYSVSPCIIR